MSSMLTALFSFPTGIPSTLLVLVLVYWLMVILGALDIEMFDLDLDLDLDTDGAEAAGGGLSGLWQMLGFAGAPLMVGLSLAVLFGWLLVAVGAHYLGSDDGGTGALVGLGLLAGGGVGGLALGGLAVRPLRPLFKARGVQRQDSLVGKVCTITTLRVDASFGQARFEDGGADLIIQVRAEPDERHVKGARALIVAHDTASGEFRIIPHDDSTERELLGP